MQFDGLMMMLEDLSSRLLVAVPDVQTLLIAAVMIQAVVLFWCWMRIASLEKSEGMMIDAIERAIRLAQTADQRSAEHIHDSERWPHHRRTVIEGWIRNCLDEERDLPNKRGRAGRQGLVDRISEAQNRQRTSTTSANANENESAPRSRKILRVTERKSDRNREAG